MKSIKKIDNIYKNSDNNRGFTPQTIIHLILGVFLVIGIFLGIIFSVPKVVFGYEKRGDFAHSYNFKFKLDVNSDMSAEETLPKVKSTANSLSNYLKQHGLANYDTWYECNNDDAFVSVNIPNSLMDSKLVKEEGTKVDCDPFISFFDNVFNLDKTLIYRWWGISTTYGANAYSALNFKDIFEIDGADTKATNNTEGHSGVLWRISQTNWTLLQNIYIDFYRFAKFQEDEKNKDNIKEENKPLLYIVNDLNGLFNKVNYHLMRYSCDGVGGNSDSYKRIYNEQNEYHNLAKEIYDEYNMIPSPKPNPEIRCLKEAYSFKKSDDGKQYFDHDNEFINGDLFKFIDVYKYDKYKWLHRYIERVYDVATYKEFFPKKITDIYENNVSLDDGSDILIPNDSYIDDEDKLSPYIDINYAWCSGSTLELSQKYLTDYKNYSWELPQKMFYYGDGNKQNESSEPPTMENFYDFISNTKQAPIFSTGGLVQANNAEVSLVIGLVIFCIAILVILLCLYKLFGLLGWLCMVFSLSMVSLILLSFIGIAFSLSFLIGLYCLALAGTLLISGIGERLKRQSKNGYELGLYVTKGFSKSLQQAIDISFVTLVFGSLFTYASANSLMPFGTVLILGSMFIFFICFCLNFLISFMLFGDNSISYVWRWGVFRPSFEISINEKNIFGDSNFYFDYYCKKINQTHLQIFSKKAFIALGFMISILIAGWTLFGMFGIFSPTLFTQNNITSKTNFDITLTSWFITAIASLAISFFLGVRHNWTAILPTLIANLVVLLLFVALNSIFFIKFDQISIFGLIITMFISNVTIASHICLVNSSWKRQNSYSAFEFKHLISTTIKNSFWFWMIGIISVICFAGAFAVSCPNQTWQLSIVTILGLIIIVTAVPWVISYLLYWCLLWRNIWIGSREKKQKINYDAIDEQEIKGINCK